LDDLAGSEPPLKVQPVPPRTTTAGLDVVYSWSFDSLPDRSSTLTKSGCACARTKFTFNDVLMRASGYMLGVDAVMNSANSVQRLGRRLRSRWIVVSIGFPCDDDSHGQELR